MRAFYLDVGGEPVLSLLHEADGGAGPAVLMCPPFGREDVASYRSRREWADSLACAGMPVLRFDLPGTGDSGGRIEESPRFESWIETVRVLAGFLRQTTGHHTAAIGIGLGGMLAVAATSGGAPIDDLVLWGVPGNGRTLARELAAIARIETDSIVAAGAPEPPPEGTQELAPGGFLLSANVVESLRRLDLAELRVFGIGRALLLTRDGIPPDDSLRAMLEASGACIDVADGDGFGGMMTVLPEAAQLPEGVRRAVEAWLAAAPARSVTIAQTSSTVPRRTTAELRMGTAAISEEPLQIDYEGRELFGILSRPTGTDEGEAALVLLNAGAIRHTGPSRLWVELARRWAANGTPTLRIDLAGIGDASGRGRSLTIADLYSPDYVRQVRAALDAIAAQTAVRRFTLLGLCAGAYWGFHTALVDDRVRLVVMLNPRLLFWDPVIVAAYDAQTRRSRLVQASAWRQLRTLRLRPLVRRLLTVAARLAGEPLRSRARSRARREAYTATVSALDRLEAMGTRTVFAFCDGEPLRESLTGAGVGAQPNRWPSAELVDFPGRDHVLRPPWMHAHVLRLVDGVLVAEHSSPRRDPKDGRTV
jgi:alpha-beta hydrolase superfamily lysophospholipase